MHYNIQTNLLNNHFENISISLNQSLNCELDVSLIDRLYYLINDTSNKSTSNNKSTQQQKPSSTKQNQADISKITKKKLFYKNLFSLLFSNKNKNKNKKTYRPLTGNSRSVF